MMKKKILFISLLLSGILMYSCSSDEEVYSCDPEINAWVNKNLDEIRTMTRQHLLQFGDEAERRAVYAALTPEQKISFWEEKILEVLELSWTEKEREHIELLLDIIDSYPYFFNSDSYQKFGDKIDLISYKWIEYAKEELNWSEDGIYALVMTVKPIHKIGNELVIKENHFEGSSSLVKTSSEVRYACNCKSKDDCSYDDSCLDVSCDIVNTCGMLHWSACNGMCGKKNN